MLFCTTSGVTTVLFFKVYTKFVGVTPPVTTAVIVPSLSVQLGSVVNLALMSRGTAIASNITLLPQPLKSLTSTV
ncbi:hypothetical protein D3C85_820890 [compost metagenome]